MKLKLDAGKNTLAQLDALTGTLNSSLANAGIPLELYYDFESETLRLRTMDPDGLARRRRAIEENLGGRDR